MIAIIGLVVLLGALPGHSWIHKHHAWEPQQKVSCYDRLKEWKPVPHDESLLAPGKTYYYPYMSRLDLNRKSANILGVDMSELCEASLYYDSCLQLQMLTTDSFRMIGFEGMSTTYRLIDDEVVGKNGDRQRYYIEGRKHSGDGGLTQITKTDNKTYLFMPDCTLDNRMSWSLLTTVPKLPKDVLKEIHDHAVELGYDKDYFTEIEYDNCKHLVM